jgi:uncharacterized SAM-binding protein YcdF (DUF218 family)
MTEGDRGSTDHLDARLRSDGRTLGEPTTARQAKLGAAPRVWDDVLAHISRTREAANGKRPSRAHGKACAGSIAGRSALACPQNAERGTMLFEFSGIMWRVVEPGNLLVLLLVIATANLYRGRRRARLFVVAVALAFVAVAVLPLGQWAIAPLEDRFPQPALPAHVDGIILLGGAVDLAVTHAHGQVATKGYAERISESLVLAHRYPDAKLLITGGNPNAVPGEVSEAEVTKRLLVAEGLDDHRVLLEGRSRNTFENAIYSVAVAGPRPNEIWLLVTSAFHMPRAVGCFRHVGWHVVPFPVDYQTSGAPLIGWSFLPDLRVLDLAWHEWLGLVAYRLLGRIDSFFPGPLPAPTSSSSAS